MKKFPLCQGICELCHIENSPGLFMASLVKEEYLYLLVPTSQSETHSKAQEISLASKMKILDYIDIMYFIYFLPMNENRVLPYRGKRHSCPAEECGLSI